jgi:hypothetical protein
MMRRNSGKYVIILDTLRNAYIISISWMKTMMRISTVNFPVMLMHQVLMKHKLGAMDNTYGFWRTTIWTNGSSSTL